MTMLILTQPGHRANAYGLYAAEILKAEGFADLAVRPLDDPGLDEHLAAADAVVLTASLPRRAQVEALVDHVRGGGGLIALRPSRLLAGEMGLIPTDTATTRPTSSPPPGTPSAPACPSSRSRPTSPRTTTSRRGSRRGRRRGRGSAPGRMPQGHLRPFSTSPSGRGR
jgi:hypothetical protein